MKNREWINDYTLLKEVNPGNPFTVPAGYFDTLQERIVSLKNLNVLVSNNAEAGFITPDNYFDELSLNIKSRIAIENQLNLEDAGFTVPEGYFSDLEERIKLSVFIESKLDRENTGLVVPSGYFNTLEQQIKSRVAVEQAMGDPSEHFSVPDGYFEGLNKNILDKTVNVKNAGRSVIIRRMVTSTAFKYATAACFALFLGGGIVLSELSSSGISHDNSLLHKQLSQVPIDELKSYLQLNVDAGDTQQAISSQDVTIDEDSLNEALQAQANSVQ